MAGKDELLVELGDVWENGRETASLARIKGLAIVNLWFTSLNVWNVEALT